MSARTSTFQVPVFSAGTVTVALRASEAPPASVAPTEKAVRTNVTRGPDAAAPPAHGGNAAVPCGFGPQGGQGCSNR